MPNAVSRCSRTTEGISLSSKMALKMVRAFPWADILVIDLEHDQWVAGTPVREVIEDDWAAVSAACARALSNANALLMSHGITEPGETIASHPPTEQSTDPHRITFGSFFPSQGWDEQKP